MSDLEKHRSLIESYNRNPKRWAYYERDVYSRATTCARVRRKRSQGCTAYRPFLRFVYTFLRHYRNTDDHGTPAATGRKRRFSDLNNISERYLPTYLPYKLTSNYALQVCFGSSNILRVVRIFSESSTSGAGINCKAVFVQSAEHPRTTECEISGNSLWIRIIPPLCDGATTHSGPDDGREDGCWTITKTVDKQNAVAAKTRDCKT